MKRFICTEMWDKAWYRKISPTQKLFWTYLFSKCDCAGVWEPDFELASFALGATVSESDMSVFGDRVKKLTCGKWRLTTFVSVQYGEALNEKSSVHRGVMKLLRKHGVSLT